MCRAKGIQLIAYLDDILVLARNLRQLISPTSIVLDILDQAGYQRNLKEILSATQTEVRILVPAVGLGGIVSDASGGQDHEIFVD